MGYALVGSRGAVAIGAGSGAAVTPSWGTGETRVAGNLLICRVSVQSSATLPTAPAGWGTAVQVAGINCSASIFYLVPVVGGESAPTIAGVAGGVIRADLSEWSGGVSASPLDQTGSGTGATTPTVATAGSSDSRVGDLVIAVMSIRYNPAVTTTVTHTTNNGVVGTVVNNDSTPATGHYSFLDGIATGNGSADQDSAAFTTTNIVSTALAIASFLPAVTSTLAASGGASAGGSGALALLMTLAGSGGAAASGSGTLSLLALLAASGGATAQGSGALALLLALQAAGGAQSGGSGALIMLLLLAATGGAIAQGSGNITDGAPPPVILDGDPMIEAGKRILQEMEDLTLILAAVGIAT